MRSLVVLSAVASMLVVVSACDFPRLPQSDRPSRVSRWAFPATFGNRDLDILFVIDNSGSMAGEQAALAANFPEFLSVLNTVPGGLPNVHVGVVSSNVGSAGQPNVPGCAGEGDDGNLLVKAGCSGLTGTFISDVSTGQGRVKNYTGSLDSLFACMAQLGTGGCGFEMHLESAYRALQPGKNPNFYRSGAYLAVIIIADEDDCSTEMGAMFGDPTAGVGSPLGPRTSFRCFEFGVKCNDNFPRAFGTKTGCRPNPNSQYMFEVDRYVQFLRGLKEDPSQVVVAAIAGRDDDQHTVVVGPDPTTPANPVVEKSCFLADPNDPNDGATPPIRIAEFVRQFGSRGSSASVCTGSFRDPLSNIANLLKVALGSPCLQLQQPLVDRDPRTPCNVSTGTDCEYECSVMDVLHPHQDNRTESVIVDCAQAGAVRPCWRIASDPAQCPVAPSLSFVVDRGGATPPAGTLVEVQCATE